MPPRPRRAIPIGDGKAALARLDALIARAGRELAPARRRRGSEPTHFVLDDRVPVAEAHLARPRGRRAGLGPRRRGAVTRRRAAEDGDRGARARTGTRAPGTVDAVARAGSPHDAPPPDGVGRHRRP